MCGGLTNNTSKMKILKETEKLRLQRMQPNYKKELCKHERGEFQFWLAQGIKYFKCKKCGENYAE